MCDNKIIIMFDNIDININTNIKQIQSNKKTFGFFFVSHNNNAKLIKESRANKKELQKLFTLQLQTEMYLKMKNETQKTTTKTIIWKICGSKFHKRMKNNRKTMWEFLWLYYLCTMSVEMKTVKFMHQKFFLHRNAEWDLCEFNESQKIQFGWNFW